MTPNVEAAKAALSHLDLVEKPKLIRTYSRDCFWYSPVLKARLDHLEADFIACPRSESEVIEILRTCFEHDVPVTTRGAGSGNYGQVMHMRHMNLVKSVEPGRVIVEPGCIIKDLDAHCKEHSGQDVRMFSSTWVIQGMNR